MIEIRIYVVGRDSYQTFDLEDHLLQATIAQLRDPNAVLMFDDGYGQVNYIPVRNIAYVQTNQK